MPSLARQWSGLLLDLWTGIPGIIADCESLEYRIYDISTEAKLDAPSQVYPAAVGTVFSAKSVNLVADRLNFGHYCARDFATFLATYTGSGRHRITWTYTYTVGAVTPSNAWFTPDQFADLEDTDILTASVSEEFDVIGGTNPIFGYCLPSDLRNEGVTTTDATDQRLATAIRVVTRQIEAMTGNHFEPRRKQALLDGRGAHNILLQEPVIWVEQMALSSMFEGQPLEVNTTDIRVYNRHLVCRMTQPDDRQNPKIELLRLGTWTTQNPPVTAFVRWPTGVQNVMITGIFGFTDPDEQNVSATGITPELIRHACKLMVMREMHKFTDFDNREDRRKRHRIQSESVQGYSVSLQSLEAGRYTGDEEIDAILEWGTRALAWGVG